MYDKKDGIRSSIIFPETGKKAQISIILGIMGIVFAWLFAFVGHIVSIIGIILGIKEYKETEKLTGLVLNIIGEVCDEYGAEQIAEAIATCNLCCDCY